MKIIATSDIHQRADKWKQLVKECQEIKPDIVTISGDIFPRTYDILEQLSFIKHLRKYAEKLKPAKLVFILGNDDNQNAIPEMQKGHDEGLWYYIDDKVVEIDGYEFVGFPWVLDYPFRYKYWIKPERYNNLRIDDFQYGEPLIINKDNKFEVIPNYEKFLKSRDSIWDSLKKLAYQVKNMDKSIWLIHMPPDKMGMDHCQSGHKVGSASVREFIEKNSALCFIAGHIHEAPEYSKVWKANIGKTLVIQGGQIKEKLHYSTVDIEDGIIKSVKHSIYGENP
jgi:Icc-related predicted phosphoesterase